MDLSQYLTSVEKEMLKQRFRIHQLLQKGHGVRKVARLEKVSSATVINIKKYLGLKINTKLNNKKNISYSNKVPWKIG